MLKKNPSQTELNDLMQLLNSGNSAATETRARELSKSYPKTMIVWKILGVAIAGQGRMAEAILPMQKAIQLDPKNAEAHRNLANAFKVLGQLNTAEIHFRKAIALNPQDSHAITSLAKILNGRKDFAEAEKICRKAITFKYDMAEVHNQLGTALLLQQKFSLAENSFKIAIMLSPTMDDAHNNLGIALYRQGKYADADPSYRQAINLNPNFANAYCNLGNNFASQNQLAEAEAAYRKTIEIDPQHQLGLSNLGSIILHNQGRKDEAKIILEQALVMNPQSSATLDTLGNVHKDLGNIETALEYYQKAITVEPAMTSSYSNLLLVAGYHAKLSPEQSLQKAKEYGKYVSAQAKHKYKTWLCQFPADNSTTKIRVGFVSGDLRKHAVTYFLEGLLRHFDKNKFELIAYPTHPKEDEITALIKPHFIKWQPIYGKNDQDAAEIIYQDALHILFDLSGHTAHNRLPMFAYKPAPIQVTWAGYPATTGMTEMDYILGDQYLIPVGQEQQFVEQVWRLPEVSGCFTPLVEDIPVTQLPALRNGHITFGCFNNLIKMNNNVVAVWSQILHAVPDAKLHLQASQLSEPSVQQQTYARYATHGIAPERLILEGITPRLDYFKSYNKIDIALDPFPRPGGTTTADTLWMSVPVLTLKGYDYWSRLGESIAHNVGQTEWIATDTEDYVRKAVTFAADTTYLKNIRTTLRTKVLASPLFDAPKFTHNFENVLTGMVEKLQLTPNKTF